MKFKGIKKPLTKKELTSRAFEVAGSNAGDIERIMGNLENAVSYVGSINKGSIAPELEAINLKAKEVSHGLVNRISKTNLLEMISEKSDILKRSLEKHSTGSDLQKLAIDINEMTNITLSGRGKYVTMPHNKIRNGIKNTANILKNGGQILDFDIESLGGVNDAGHNQVDFITEIGFKLYDVEGKVNKKAIEEFQANTIDYDFYMARAIKESDGKPVQPLSPEASLMYDRGKKLREREMQGTFDRYPEQGAFGENNKTLQERVNTSKEFGTLFGFDEDEYNSINKRLKGMKGRFNTSSMTGEEKLLVHRLSMMSDSRLEISKSGFVHKIKTTGGETENTIENAMKGLNVFRNIGIEQEKYIPKGFNGGLKEYRKNVLLSMQELVSTGQVNNNLANSLFGGPIDVREHGIITGHNIYDFDISGFAQVTGVNMAKDENIIFDTLQAFREIENHNGRGKHVPFKWFSDLSPEKVRDGGVIKNKKFGDKSQDAQSFTRGYVKEGLATHNAEVDTGNHFNEFFYDKMDNNKTLFEHMQEQFNMIPESNGSTDVDMTNDNIFLFNGSAGTMGKSEKNALSFTANGASGEIQFTDGTILGRKESSIIDNNGGWTGKTNTLYNMKEYEVDINSKEMDKILGEISNENNSYFSKLKGLEKLYVQEISEFIDKDIAKEFGIDLENRPVHFRISGNKNELHSQFSLFKDGKIIGTDIVNIAKDETGEFKAVNVKDEIKAMSYETGQNTVDSVNRKVVDTNGKMLKYFYNNSKNNIGYSHAGMVAELVREKNLKGEALKNVTNMTQKLLKEREFSGAIDDLYDAIGYKYNGKDFIPQGAFTEGRYIDNFVSAFSPIIKRMEEGGLINLDGMFDSIDVGEYNIAEKKAYRSIKDGARTRSSFNLLIGEVENIILNADHEKEPELASLKRNVSRSAEKFAVIDVDKRDLTGRNLVNFGARDSSINYSTVNLQGENTLFNAFFDGMWKNNKNADANGIEGYSTVRRIIEYLNDSREFTNVAKITEDELNNLIKDKKSPQHIAAFIQGNLFNHKMLKDKNNNYKNLGKGIKFERIDFDLVSDRAQEILSNKFKDKDVVDKMLDNVVKGLSESETITGESATKKELVERLYKYFMYDEKDFLENVNNNLSKEYRDVELQHHNMAKRDSKRKAKELANAMTSGDMNPIVTDDGIYVQDVDGYERLNTYKYVQNNGTILVNSGNVNYNMKTVINASEAEKKGIGNTTLDKLGDLISIDSVTEKERMSSRSMISVVNNALEEGTSPAVALKRALQKVDGKIVNSSTMVERLNGAQVRINNTRFDTNDIFKILPDIKDDFLRRVSEAGAYDGTNIENHVKLLDDMITGMIKEYEETGIRKGIESSSAQVSNTLAYNRNAMNLIMDELIKIYGGEETTVVDDQEISYSNPIGNMNINVKSTVLEKQEYIMVNEVAKDVHIPVENTNRDPYIQAANTAGFDKEVAEGKLEKLRENKLYDQTYINTEEKFLPEQAALDKDMFGGDRVNLRTMQATNLRINTMLEADFADVYNGGTNNIFYKSLQAKYPYMSADELKSKAKVIARQASNISTYEQQAWVNSRVGSIFFDKGQEKVISGKNFLNTDTSIRDGVDPNKITPTFDKDGNIRYKQGLIVKKRDVLGEFGDNRSLKIARDTGIFKGRYYNKETGKEIGEAGLNTVVKEIIGKKGYDVKNVDDMSKLFKEVNNIFDFKYTLNDLSDSAGKKIVVNATEKATIKYGRTGMGIIDEDIIKDLNELVNVKDFNITKGTVLSEAAIEEIQERARRAGVDPSAIIDRIRNERESMSDAIMEHNAIKRNGVSVITSLNVGKHQTTSAPLNNILEGAKNTLDDDELKGFISSAYGIKDVKEINGSMIINDYEKINFKSKEFNDFLGSLSDDKRNAIGNILSDTGRIDIHGNAVDNTDNAIGNVGYSTVSQIVDDQSGISSSSIEMGYLTKRRKKLTSDIEKVKVLLNKDPDNNGVKAKLNGLERELKETYSKENYLKYDKGLKFTERMNINLQAEVWNKKMMSGIEEGLQNDIQRSMFDKAFGHAYKEGVMAQEYDGEAFLKDTVQRLRDGVLLGHGETSLSDALETEEGMQKYGYLADIYKGDIDKISVEKAELLVAEKAGEEAMRLNRAGIDHIKANDLQKDGWNIIDLEKDRMALDVGGQADTVLSSENNPYNQNSLIKIGDNYVAVGRMSENVFDGSLIKDEQRKAFNKLDRINTRYEASKGTADEISEGEYNRQIEDFMEDFKRIQKKDVTSKTGLAGKTNSTRLAMSFGGKGQGILPDESYLRAHALDEENILNKAKFMGESLSSAISNKVYVDAAFISEEAFDSMGYFEEGRMRRFFSGTENKEMLTNAFGDNMKNVKNMSEEELRSGMINTLEVYGDAALTTRFPNIQDASDKAAMIYLSKGMKGEKNAVATLSYTGMGAKLDYDGDSFYLAMITKKNAHIDTYLTDISRNKNNTSLVKEVNASITKRAFTTNQFWHEQVLAGETKMDKINRSGGDFYTVSANRLVNDDLFSKVKPTGDRGITDMLSDVSDFNNQFEGLLDNGLRMAPTEALNNYMGSEAGIEAIKASGLSNEEFAEKFANNLFTLNYANEQVAKTSKGSVGAANVTNFKVRAMATLGLDKTADDYYYKKDSLVELVYQAEEAVISAKSATDTLASATRSEKWNKAVDTVMSGNASGTTRSTMKNWLIENVSGNTRMNELWLKGSDGVFRDKVRGVFEEGTADDEILTALKDNSDERTKRAFSIIADDTISVIEDIGNTKDGKGIYESFRKGNSVEGIIGYLKDPLYMENTIGQVKAEALNNISGSGRDTMYRKASLGLVSEDSNVFLNFENSQAPKRTYKDMAEGIIEGAANMFKSSMPKNGLAMGALGLAAGMLVSGFAAGRPRPADVQAMEEAQSQLAPMDSSLMLADPGAQMSSGGGYVVNINARTNGDKNKAAQAIQQALGKGMGANVNLTMNVGSEYSNISNREIENAIMATLG